MAEERVNGFGNGAGFRWKLMNWIVVLPNRTPNCWAPKAPADFFTSTLSTRGSLERTANPPPASASSAVNQENSWRRNVDFLIRRSILPLDSCNRMTSALRLATSASVSSIFSFRKLTLSDAILISEADVTEAIGRRTTRHFIGCQQTRNIPATIAESFSGCDRIVGSLSVTQAKQRAPAPALALVTNGEH